MVGGGAVNGCMLGRAGERWGGGLLDTGHNMMVRYFRLSRKSRKSNKKCLGRSRSITVSRRSRSLGGGEAEEDGGCHDERERGRMRSVCPPV